ncbi:peptidase M23-like protein [Winogradskyella epiphytica]|uniref:Peptidase M23-like protein n=1 Tax=Winogradskyella epiphytica TaxID=262005 RepID=A0A2V4X4D8_9FLAO|nr:peptidoglycan DD-metalloendopeptidase family protein [Winogradskyella epiphytica]PYE79590.1 peptidase M23-like protein [Winogradskyella epiphytica]GGW74115.1 hypothetical protein GCM10008085_27900 [Winogradskyella epiphytica]
MSCTRFEAFLKTLKPFPLLGENLKSEEYISIDLSVDNIELNEINIASSDDLELYIFRNMKAKKAKVAFGGYLEKRGIYQRSDYFTKEHPEDQRHIHLGVDLWAVAGSSIYSPLQGVIHSFKNNTNYGDYGPTIILKHDVNNQSFYTLYGHLSLESIANLKVGSEVKPGQQLATLGTSEVNGDYPPHLHFQIIKDLQDNYGDYPGVCSDKDLGFYRENCPDPKALIGLKVLT